MLFRLARRQPLFPATLTRPPLRERWPCFWFGETRCSDPETDPIVNEDCQSAGFSTDFEKPRREIAADSCSATRSGGMPSSLWGRIESCPAKWLLVEITIHSPSPRHCGFLLALRSQSPR